MPFSGGSRPSTARPASSSANTGSGTALADSTRQWTFTGFEWSVRDVHKLRDFVENLDSKTFVAGQLPDHGEFEVLKQSPMLGDGKFKLEIAPTLLADASGTSNPPILSLYITSLVLDSLRDDYELCASMMCAIKCQDDRMGERGARPEWVWEYWQNDWVFRQESEVWECSLPTLSSLLENPRIRETDSFVICVQIHCPVGPSIPQHPSVYYVPKDLLDGLEASLDNSNTGDVRFICLERYSGSSAQGELSTAPSNESTNSVQSATSATSIASSPFNPYATARKRIIYAHSDILIRRSEYFATMFSSAFAENANNQTGERKVYTVVVEEADFETMYWLLKYCYANWLLFKRNDDPRAAVEGIGAGWSAKWLSGHQGEWDWKTFHKGGASEDGRSTTSGDNLPLSTTVSHNSGNSSEVYQQTPTHTTSSTIAGQRNSPTKSSTSTGTAQGATSQRTTAIPTSPSASSTSRRPTQPITINVASSSAASSIPTRTTGKPVGTAPSGSTRYSISPRTSRHQGGLFATPDPHPHPTPAPSPASALSVYQVAHRYLMPNLASLAMEHIMTTITPESSFALLLATNMWEELHNLIQDFVIERWDVVSTSQEFEQCCKEVAAGEWGTEGGTTLMSVFRRLRSPVGSN
ncbi:hypothetical protein BJ165DRAFT_1335495 [Panaeolus papilionaceus]|nr:hypothetical protein BJ165DRAFT_1335495 [Panaeolus papilionaceus]